MSGSNNKRTETKIYMNEEEIKKLINSASKSRNNAYAARSEHKFGSSVMTFSGEIFGGCNIESNISGLGCCAERVAINNAITAGNYKFKALMTYNKNPVLPCGACLQYLMEFYAISKEDIQILSAGENGELLKHTLLELLPHGYLSKNTVKADDYRDK